MRKILTLLAFCLSLSIAAQDTDCPTMIADAHEHALLEKALLNNAVAKSDDNCNVIRVVVHVIYDGNQPNTSFNGWISEAQVLSQIRITNQFFRNDSLMYHPTNTALGYTIKLADVDPDGNATNGINYVDGNAIWGNRWSTYGLKHNDSRAVTATEVATQVGWNTTYVVPWLDDRERYLNIYVVQAIDKAIGTSVQAYAYSPSQTPSLVFGSYVVFNAFGAKQLDENTSAPYFNLKSYTNRGQVLTHELLHNFAIKHTFHGTNSCTGEVNCNTQGDGICDTPQQTQPVSQTSGSCGFISYNVMDYIHQNYKHRITEGQAMRARSAIAFTLQDFMICGETEPECPPSNGDFNNDGKVDFVDFSIISAAFGSLPHNSYWNELADMNCDGRVDILDFSIFLEYFGNVYTPQQVVEHQRHAEVKLTVTNLLGQRVILSDTMPIGVYIAVQNGLPVKILIRNDR